MIEGCPGSQRFKKPFPEMFKCGRCGTDVEIWSDEFTAECPNCKFTVTRANIAQCCLDWCKYARECVGDEIYNRYLKSKNEKRKSK